MSPKITLISMLSVTSTHVCLSVDLLKLCTLCKRVIFSLILLFVWSTVLFIILSSTYTWMLSSIFLISVAFVFSTKQFVLPVVIPYLRCRPVVTGCSLFKKFFLLFSEFFLVLHTLRILKNFPLYSNKQFFQN